MSLVLEVPISILFGVGHVVSIHGKDDSHPKAPGYSPELMYPHESVLVLYLEFTALSSSKIAQRLESDSQSCCWATFCNS